MSANCEAPTTVREVEKALADTKMQLNVFEAGYRAQREELRLCHERIAELQALVDRLGGMLAAGMPAKGTKRARDGRSDDEEPPAKRSA